MDLRRHFEEDRYCRLARNIQSWLGKGTRVAIQLPVNCQDLHRDLHRAAKSRVEPILIRGGELANVPVKKSA